MNGNENEEEEKRKEKRTSVNPVQMDTIAWLCIAHRVPTLPVKPSGLVSPEQFVTFTPPRISAVRLLRYTLSENSVPIQRYWAVQYVHPHVVLPISFRP